MNRILIFGDSLPYGKWGSCGGWVTRLRNYLDEKYNLKGDEKFLVYNLGVPGDMAVSLVKRLESELAYRIKEGENNLVIFSIGLNDSCFNNRILGRQATEIEFKEAVRNLIAITKKHSCKLSFIGLTPVNPARSKGLIFDNKEVQRFDKYLSEVCRQESVDKLELFEELEKLNFADCLVDSAHPNTEGHKILFQKILKYFESYFS